MTNQKKSSALRKMARKYASRKGPVFEEKLIQKRFVFVCRDCRKRHYHGLPEETIDVFKLTCSCGRLIEIKREDYSRYCFKEIFGYEYKIIDGKTVKTKAARYLSINYSTNRKPKVEKVSLNTASFSEELSLKLLRDRECPVCGHKYHGSMICPNRPNHPAKYNPKSYRERSEDYIATKEFLNLSHSDKINFFEKD